MNQNKKEIAKAITKENVSPVIKKFQRIQIQTHYKDECWSIDLIDRSSLSKSTKTTSSFSQKLTIILNMHGRLLLKINQGKGTTIAFKKLIETSMRKPQKVWSGRGKEFYNTTFLHYLNEQNILIYSTNSDLKAIFVERFNRTLLDLIKEPMYIEGKGNWLNHLDAALQNNNSRVHGTAKMTLYEMSLNKPIPKIEYHKNKVPNFRAASPTFPKFQVGDFVRVPDKRNIYSKGYTTNWNRKLFKIHKINSTNPVPYTLNDENGEIIQGKYDEQELLKSTFNFDSNNKTLKSMNIFNKME